MTLPDWPMVRITRRKEMVQSRGINYSDNYQDGDLADSENLSVRRWPYIATRNARKRLEEYQGVTALTAWNGLVVIRPGDHDGTLEDELLYRGEHVDWLEHREEARQFAAVNTRLVIWPDKVYLDMTEKTVKPLGAKIKASKVIVSNTTRTIQAAKREEATEETENEAEPVAGTASLQATAVETVTGGESDPEKEDQEAPEAPTLKETTQTSITINARIGEEYSINSGVTWVKPTDGSDSLVFDGLDVATYYDIIARLSGTETLNPSPASEPLNVRTNKEIQKAPAAPEITAASADSITIKVRAGEEYSITSGQKWVKPKSGETEMVFGGLDATKDVSVIARMYETVTKAPSKNSEEAKTTTKKDGYFRFEIASFETAKGDTWQAGEDLTQVFHVGDGVEASGFTKLEKNNRSFVIRDVSADVITTSISGEDTTAEAGTEDEAEIYIERKIPALDYICESGNRLWGCENASKTIFVSALGDPTNFFVIGTGATDSYAVNVATPGDFTGCCKLSSSVLFWKEQVLHKFLGSYPAEYIMYTYEMEGVRSGCEKSLTIINDALFYVGLHGVFTYAGGTPADISQVFGEHLITEAVGGTDGEKYWMSCKDNGKESLYVFSPNDGVWLKEDSFRFSGIARDGEDVYLLRKDGSVWLADSREQDPQIEWKLEYKPFYETIEGRKRVSRLLIRMEMPEGAWLRVETSTDDERWQEAGLIKGPKTDTVPVMVQPRRGDMYKVRLRGHGPCVIKGCLREYIQGGYQGGDP